MALKTISHSPLQLPHSALERLSWPNENFWRLFLHVFEWFSALPLIHRAQSLPFLHDSQMSKFAAQLRLPPLQHAPLVLSQHYQVWSLFFKIWIKLGKLCSADRWRGLKDVFFKYFWVIYCTSMNQMKFFWFTQSPPSLPCMTLRCPSEPLSNYTWGLG